MPGLAIPPELKRITQFVRRAEELDRDVDRPESRLVAYYCRQHAVRTGIALSNSSAATKCLGGILTSLESEKEAMAVFSDDESRLICRNFAMGVFDRADGEDRAGHAGKSTAKTFYAAAVFLEILRHFDADEKGEGEEEKEKTDSRREEDERRVYAKWKATEILKAIKEGREIVPGGYNEKKDEDDAVVGGGEQENDDDEEEEEEEKNDARLSPPPPATTTTAKDDFDDLPPAPPTNVPTAPPPPPKEEKDEEGTEVELDPPPPPPAATDNDPPPPYDDDYDDAPPPPAVAPPPPTAPVPAPAPAKKSWFGRKRTGRRTAKDPAVADAAELTRFALAALESNDVDLGISRLQQALRTLTK